MCNYGFGGIVSKQRQTDKDDGETEVYPWRVLGVRIAPNEDYFLECQRVGEPNENFLHQRGDNEIQGRYNNATRD